jgi:hypothetical protein
MVLSDGFSFHFLNLLIMQLLVFGHSGYAYLVPYFIIEKAKKLDKLYEDTGDESAWDFFYKELKKEYTRIKVGHVLSGDIG